LRASILGLVFAVGLAAGGCRIATFFPRFLARTVELGFQDIAPVAHKLTDPVRPDAELAILWVGHATVLVQIGDRFVLTDPVFTDTVGQVSKRLVEPGIDAENLPPIDVTLVSHMHFDHLSLGSLERIETKVRDLIVPQRGLVYVPGFPFRTWELATWESWERDGLRVTAVPVRHNGFRYAIDGEWMTTSYTGYVVEYAGRTVYFGGDTAATRGFRAAAERFPAIDLAILPIAPIYPREFMCRAHIDPGEAIQAFLELGARYLVPMHFDTFVNSTDELGEAPRELTEAARRAGVRERVVLLEIGEQRVLERVRRMPDAGDQSRSKTATTGKWSELPAATTSAESGSSPRP
jgi:L-ascorbate metabolism protein UlaG (beta-lactamase superfamily)